jgi:prevent-host-death family protein
MRTVTAMDMRKRLGEILDAASAGERILIERDGRPLAYLVSVEDAARLEPDVDERRQRRLAALDRLVAFGKEMREKHPDPDDGLSYSEWRRREYDRRDEQLTRAASGAGCRTRGKRTA